MTANEALPEPRRGYSDMSLKAYREAVHSLGAEAGLANDASVAAVDAALTKLPDTHVVSEATAAHFLRLSGKTMERKRRAQQRTKPVKLSSGAKKQLAGPAFHLLKSGGYGYRMGDLRRWLMESPLEKRENASKAAVRREEKKRQEQGKTKKTEEEKWNGLSLENKFKSMFRDHPNWNRIHPTIKDHQGRLLGFVGLHPYSSQHLEEAFTAGATIADMSFYEALFEAVWVSKSVRMPWEELADEVLRKEIVRLSDERQRLRDKGLEGDLGDLLPPGLSAPVTKPL